MTIELILAFCFGFIISYILGSLLRQSLIKKDKRKADEGLGTTEGSLLALFAFFMGFTFSIAASKLETIRQASINESNAIGTVLLRTKMYDTESEANFKNLLKTYIKTRVDYFEKDNAEGMGKKYLEIGQKEFDKVWDYAVSLQKSHDFVEESRLMLPALNDMIDAVTTRESALNAKLPNTIIFTLIFLSVCSCFIIGFGTNKKSLVSFVDLIYITVIAIMVSLIIDAGNPRKGLINSSKSNQEIVNIYKQL